MMETQNYNGFSNSIKNSKLIEDGTLTFLTNIASLQEQSPEKLRQYLELGANSETINLEEEVARLLTIASLDNYQISPIENIMNSIYVEGISNIKSSFLTSALNKTTEFEKEYDNFFTEGSFSNFVTNIDEASSGNKEELIDSVFNQITIYYSKRLDQNIKDKKLDLRYYEPLTNWFEYSLNATKERIKGENTYENKGKYQ